MINLRCFSKQKFTANNFLRMLLSGLEDKGIVEIHENLLCRKLFFYYQNPEFKELFQDVGIDSDGKVNLQEALEYEKNRSGYLFEYSSEPGILCFSYNYENGKRALSQYKKYLSKDEFKKMNQLIEELATTLKLERRTHRYQLQVYHASPNQYYHLTAGFGKKIGNIKEILITDGTIKSDEMQKKKVTLYDDHSIKNVTMRNMKVENAKYVAVQKLENNIIRRLEIYTEVTDFCNLNSIQKIVEPNLSCSIRSKEPHLIKIYPKMI